MSATPPQLPRVHELHTPVSASPATTATLPTQPSSPPDETHAFAQSLIHSLSIVHLNNTLPTVVQSPNIRAIHAYDENAGYENNDENGHPTGTSSYHHNNQSVGTEIQSGDDSEIQNIDDDGLTMRASTNSNSTRARAESDAAAAFHLLAPPPSRRTTPDHSNIQVLPYHHLTPNIQSPSPSYDDQMSPAAQYDDRYLADEDSESSTGRYHNDYVNMDTAEPTTCICDPTQSHVGDIIISRHNLVRCGFCQRFRTLNTTA